MKAGLPVAVFLSVLGALGGCGTQGAEVRASISPAEWTPRRMLLLAPVVPGDAIPPSGTLPAGLTRPTAEEAGTGVFDAIRAELAGSATVFEVTTAFSRSTTAEVADRAARQWRETRAVDPGLGMQLAEEEGADAVLLTAVLRYGPEAETEVSTQAQSVNTKVGTTDVGISSAATRIIIRYNVQIRCAVIRVADGATVWDAGVSRREKPTLLREVTQQGVLADAVRTLCGVFPWRRVEEGKPPAGRP